MRIIFLSLTVFLVSFVPRVSQGQGAFKNPGPDPCVLCAGKWNQKYYEKCLKLLEKRAGQRFDKKTSKKWLPPELFMDSSFEGLEKRIMGGDAQAVSMGFRLYLNAYSSSAEKLSGDLSVAVATNPHAFLSNLKYYVHFMKKVRNGKQYLRAETLNDNLIDWPEISREGLGLLKVPEVKNYSQQHLQVLAQKREAIRGVQDPKLKEERKLVLGILEKDLETGERQPKIAPSPQPTPLAQRNGPKTRKGIFWGWFKWGE
jgi:hypothetical protein